MSLLGDPQITRRDTLGRLIPAALSFIDRGYAEPGNSELGILERISRAYAAMRPSFMMKARIWKRVSIAEFANETDRLYRIIRIGEDQRVDLIGDSNRVCLRRGQKYLLYSSGLRLFAELDVEDPNSALIREQLQLFSNQLFFRFADLAESSPVILATKAVTIKAGGMKRECSHVKLASRPGSAKWTGELWADSKTSLVWRAKLEKRDEHSQLIEEEINWEEIVMGAENFVPELDWRPPPNAERVTKWRHLLLYA